ncbi:MAG: 6-carboxytetrahydropterin synthase QueD [Deltaproteobacteria bacterium]|nr:6-carboxytetrahydropterin synthase QueD [Deltaproteobacteria bacterium]MBI3077938.1 6-carboxytetrahydropterin synthase QueD [Deltaproteobacteria bacterium]
MYELTVESVFSAAHNLRNYEDGRDEPVHGHNWRVRVTLAAPALDDQGLLIDFKVLKTALEQVTDELDHRYLNELEPFLTVNPSTENVAAYLYRRLQSRLPRSAARLKAVTLYESDDAWVSYFGE